MWIETELEKFMHKKLIEEFNKQAGTTYYSQYDVARSYLVNNIFSYIATIEPDLTDHSDKHIENVLNNVWYLIQDDLDKFNAIELYLLCLCVLFHDSGNINGRNGHNKKIAEIYSEVVGTNSNRNQEKRLVIMIVKAHCGKSKKNDSDTLTEVEEVSDLYSREIHVREIASIIRFADELAEGPQRTSDFLIKQNKINETSLIYHLYASITNMFIDKRNRRIAVTYNIELPIDNTTFQTLMQFVYNRIIKLDMERRYCKYYASVLDKFKTTEAQINILNNGEDIADLPKILLGDKYILSNELVEDIIYDRYPELKIESIIRKIGD